VNTPWPNPSRQSAYFGWLGESHLLMCTVRPNSALLTDTEPHPLKWTSGPNVQGSEEH
jgi:hypothetical protein